MNAPASGYTLLEMVVVLAIIAMATAMVAPMGYRMIGSWRDATQVQDVLGQLERLPTVVRDSGNPLDTSQHNMELPIKLPPDWQLHFDQPLRVLANGACNNAAATLTTPHQTITLHIDAPFCRVQRT